MEGAWRRFQQESRERLGDGDELIGVSCGRTETVERLTAPSYFVFGLK